MTNPKVPQSIFESEDIIVSVRQAEMVDAKAILGLSRHIGRETDYLSFGREGLPWTIEEERAIINKYASSPNSIMLVAEVDDQLIGFATVSAMDMGKQSHVAEIGISIIKEYWSLGIGTMLMEGMIAFAQDVGLKVLTLEVVTDNLRAIDFYHRLGFKQVGRLSQRLQSGNRYRLYDTYVVELLLD